ncbi:MAG: YggS family pyridoxal phosphate-dependent enzyme [Bacilli bacterium]
MEHIARNIANIEQVIRRHKRDDGRVDIIGVTKYSDVATTEAIVTAGITHLGENKTKDMQLKYEALKHMPITWHFIGTLQTRKVKEIIEFVDYIHSVDRVKLAEEISKRATRPIQCFIQVNVSGEETKQGVAPEQLIEFVQNIQSLPNINVVGLMTMAPNTENEQTIRQVFHTLKQLQEAVATLHLPNAPCEMCSMGMSGDYPIAVEEGAAWVRIGSALVAE